MAHRPPFAIATGKRTPKDNSICWHKSCVIAIGWPPWPMSWMVRMVGPSRLLCRSPWVKIENIKNWPLNSGRNHNPYMHNYFLINTFSTIDNNTSHWEKLRLDGWIQTQKDLKYCNFFNRSGFTLDLSAKLKRLSHEIEMSKEWNMYSK